MMAGFPLPWSCIHTKKLDEENNQGFYHEFKEAIKENLE